MTDLFRVVWASNGEPADDLEDIALNCEWAKGLIYCDMQGFAVEQDGALLLLDECGNHRYPPEGLFQVQWLDRREDQEMTIPDQSQLVGTLAADFTGGDVHGAIDRAVALERARCAAIVRRFRLDEHADIMLKDIERGR